jgi:adenine-specific DNA-methyltransferase
MDKLIQNFSVKSIADFFKNKISSFSPNSENLNYILKDTEFEHFSDLQKIGEVEFINSDELIVFACKFQGILSERSSKKRQFEIAKKVLKEDFKDGAIFIFYDENDCFRFSFIRKNYGNKDQKFSNWKRFTYFVDPSRTNKTFKNRINGCNFSSLEDIQEAFSVEKLNKKFYEEIATAFYSLIGGKVNINKKEVSFESCLQLPSTPTENRKVYQEFAVRLIGRTIFCWFLKNKKSDGGIPLIPEEWLSSNMVASVNNEQHNYYHSIIEKLFFLVLNKKHEDRKPYVLPNNHEFVPFLNGGLFEAQDDDFFPKDSKGIHSQNFALNIPNQWFRDFFETLEQYNFTIDENSINDFEVSIDPEMLGTIFENLLAEIDPDTAKSARKSTGSFYTPREIVDYMVEQSLLQYIKTKTKIEDEENLEILLKDDAENPFNEKQTIAILEALSEVKILDPACGSGAFPMGVLHKIIVLLKKLDKGAVWWKAKQLDKIDNALVRKAMEEKLSNANSDYIRKIGVIQHSIYGVDIQPIAAEISKLRSFLSLIIDENIDDNHPDGNRGIEPLPNLEFKFVTANTLISLEKGNTIGKSMSFDFGETSDLQIQLQKIRSAYLQATPTDKQKLKTDFEELQTQIYKNEIKAGGQNKRAQQLAAWKPFSNESSNWFDSDWMFGVEKFDVVIGNPPYVDSETMVLRDNAFRNYLKDTYDFADGNWDLFIVFIEKGLQLTKNDGVFTYIVPNKLISAKYGNKTRKKINQLDLIELRDYSRINVFVTADVYPITFMIRNSKNNIFSNFSVMKDLIEISEVNPVKLSDYHEDTLWDKYFFENETLNLLLKLNAFNKIINFGSTITGSATVGEAYLIKEKLLDIQHLKDSFKLINTGTIDQFKSLWSIKNTQYIKAQYQYPRVKSKDLEEMNYTRYVQSKSPKIIIAGMSKIIEAYFDVKGEYLGGKSTTIIIDDFKKLKFLTGILNSTLISFYINKVYNSLKMSGGYLNIGTEVIKAIPLPPSIDLDVFEIEIENLNDCEIDNTFIENKKNIDVKIYKLYELTHEEVLIVEPEFSLSKQEYEAFTM